jgi:hypothetical protein
VTARRLAFDCRQEGFGRERLLQALSLTRPWAEQVEMAATHIDDPEGRLLAHQNGYQISSIELGFQFQVGQNQINLLLVLTPVLERFLGRATGENSITFAAKMRAHSPEKARLVFDYQNRALSLTVVLHQFKPQ